MHPKIALSLLFAGATLTACGGETNTSATNPTADDLVNYLQKLPVAEQPHLIIATRVNSDRTVTITRFSKNSVADGFSKQVTEYGAGATLYIPKQENFEILNPASGQSYELKDRLDNLNPGAFEVRAWVERTADEIPTSAPGDRVVTYYPPQTPREYGPPPAEFSIRVGFGEKYDGMRSYLPEADQADGYIGSRSISHDPNFALFNKMMKYVYTGGSPFEQKLVVDRIINVDASLVAANDLGNKVYDKFNLGSSSTAMNVANRRRQPENQAMQPMGN